MAIQQHPPQGSIVIVNYDGGFKVPEMVKTRLAVILSPHIKNRARLSTVVPLSMTTPPHLMPYHKQIEVPFEIPQKWNNGPCWIKGDMVNSVGFHRMDLLRLGKDQTGKKIYQTQPLPEALFKLVKLCVLHGMGLSSLTKHL